MSPVGSRRPPILEYRCCVGAHGGTSRGDLGAEVVAGRDGAVRRRAGAAGAESIDKILCPSITIPCLRLVGDLRSRLSEYLTGVGQFKYSRKVIFPEIITVEGTCY